MCKSSLTGSLRVLKQQGLMAVASKNCRLRMGLALVLQDDDITAIEILDFIVWTRSADNRGTQSIHDQISLTAKSILLATTMTCIRQQKTTLAAIFWLVSDGLLA